MLIKEKKGTLSTTDIGNREVDYLPIEWYETGKRILHKHTIEGRSITLKFLNENPALQQNDILYTDERLIIAVEIKPCNAIVIHPKDAYELASLCYEIGNKHLPLFYQDDELLVPFEKPLFNQLISLGYCVKQEERKLLHQLKTTVSPHVSNGGESLFSKIIKLTTSAE